MRNVKILDCTLRDGGRINNCKFKDIVITEIAKGLMKANVDIIEMGFLRSQELVKYQGDSTFLIRQHKYSHLRLKTIGKLYLWHLLIFLCMIFLLWKSVIKDL